MRAPLLLAALAGGLAACGQPVPCDPLCARAKRCEEQVITALVARLPSRSQAFARVKQAYPERIGRRAVAACGPRCDRLRSSSWWQDQLAPCLRQPSCEAFARCVAPFLEP
jgi:hypothetical protein